jgi:hypothetical protein
VIIKLDNEKAYDRVNLNFLFEILRSRGFGETWIEWVRKIVIGGSVSIMANGEESNTFKTGKGLRQGDPMPPLLFNLIGDVLTKMLMKASRGGLIKGLMENFRPGGLLALQYADDTLLFSSCDRNGLRNMKIVLMLFEKNSRMRINFSKSKFIPMNLIEEDIHEISHILKCPVGALPFKCLGVPIHFEKLKREELQPVVDKLIRRAAGWRGRPLTYSSRRISSPLLNFLNGQ